MTCVVCFEKIRIAGYSCPCRSADSQENVCLSCETALVNQECPLCRMPYPPFKKRMSKNFDAYIKELKKHQLQAMKPCVHASAFYHVLIALGMALNTIKYVLQQHEDFQVELLKRIVDDLYLIMNDDISADVFYAFYEYAETLVEEMDYEGPEVWTLYEMVDNMMALMDIREEKAAQKRIYQERAKATRHMKLRVKMNRRHKCQRMNKKWT